MTRPAPHAPDQPDLWAGVHARTTDPVTSHLAAESMQTAATEHERIILEVLRSSVFALTAWGIAARCELDYVQVGKRLGKLREDRRIRKSGQRYPNPSGRLADAYVLARGEG